MKTRTSMLLAFLFAATVNTYAQEGSIQHRTIEERVKAVVDKISDSLKLNEAQQQNTAAVFTEYYTSLRKSREEARANGTRPDRSVIEKLSNDRDDKLKGIFTEDQFKKFKDDIEPGLRPQHPQGTQGSNS